MMSPRAGWKDWGLVILLMAAMIFSLLDRFVLSVLLEPIKKDLGVTDAQLGLLNGVAFGLFYAVMGLPLGWLADRWSRKGAIVLGVAVWSLATAACGLVTGFYQLLAARVFVGAGEAGISPASYSLVYDRFPRHRLSTAISLLQTGSMLGAGLAIFLVGIIYTAILHAAPTSLPFLGALKPWQLTFIVVALPGIPFVALLAFIRDPQARVRRHTEPSDITMRAALAKHPRSYSYVMAGMSGIVLAMYSLLSWAPAILMREFAWTPAQVAMSYGVIVLVVGPVGLLFGGWMCDVLVRREVKGAHGWIGCAAACAALPCFIAIGFCSRPGAFLVAMALAQCALAVPNGIGPALIQILTPAGARSRVSALYVLVINAVGLGIGPMAIGTLSGFMIARHQGLRQAVSVVASIFLVAAALLLWRLARSLARGGDSEILSH
jgi:MFS family permease